MKGIQIPIVNENYELIGFIDEFEYYKKLKKSFDETIATTYTSCVGFDKNDLAMKGCAIDTMILNKYQYDIKETGAYMNGFRDGVRSMELTLESKLAWITEALNALSNQPFSQTKNQQNQQQ